VEPLTRLHRATQLLLAHQIPRIEEHEASRAAIAERSPLLPPPSPEEKRMRNLEIARILRESDSIAQESTDMNGVAPDALEPAKEPE